MYRYNIILFIYVMGNQLDKNKYKPLFDPITFDLDSWIKYYQNMEQHFPIQDIQIQINKCYNYLTNVTVIHDMEKYMREGAFVLGMIKEVKKEDWIKNNEAETNYYNQMYDEVYGMMKALR